MHLLLLRLEAPLQSWGENAQWDDRDTASMPTKSGVVGLIACCMGLQRGDEKIPRMHKALSFGIRTDEAGSLGVDFQTVQAQPLYTANGGKRSPSASTIISHKQYLQDASFLVALTSAEETLLQEIAHALCHPVWTPYLGRKSCVPTCPILEADTTQYETMKQAFEQHPLSAKAIRSKKAGDIIHLTAQMDDPNGIHQRKDDRVESTNPTIRRFIMRNVCYLDIVKEVEKDVSISTHA